MHLIRMAALAGVLAISFSAAACADPHGGADLKRLDADAASSTISRDATPAFGKLATALSGDWWVSVKYAPDKKYPDGQSSEGTEVWHLGPGGMPLMGQFHTRYAGGAEDRADSALVWRDAAGELHGLWCAAVNDHGCTPLAIEWQGGKAILSGEFTRQGRTYAWRQEFTFDGTHKFTQQLFQGEKGQALKRVQTVAGERQ